MREIYFDKEFGEFDYIFLCRRFILAGRLDFKPDGAEVYGGQHIRADLITSVEVLHSTVREYKTVTEFLQVSQVIRLDGVNMKRKEINSKRFNTSPYLI